jgi:hypothetical protein
VHTAEPLVPGPSRLKVAIAIAKLKKYKSTGSDQIPAELIQAGGEILLSEIHKLINSVWNKEELPDEWNESIIVPVHRKGDRTNNYRGIALLSTYSCVQGCFYLLHTKCYRKSSCQGHSAPGGVM